jgi:hypothetical protein
MVTRMPGSTTSWAQQHCVGHHGQLQSADLQPVGSEPDPDGILGGANIVRGDNIVWGDFVRRRHIVWGDSNTWGQSLGDHIQRK